MMALLSLAGAKRRSDYRVSSLDKFKNKQLRPSRRSRDGAIGPVQKKSITILVDELHDER
jgi:hypothetical protein